MKTLDVTGAWRFAAGDAVPTWLLDQEPTRPGTTMADLTFEVDCAVFETGGRYIIVPQTPTPTAVLRLSRSGGLKLSAPGRSVQMVNDWTTFPGADEPGLDARANGG